MITDTHKKGASGYLHLFIYLTLSLASFAGMIYSIKQHQVLWILSCLVILAFSLFMFAGLFIVNPNESRVMQLFGSYTGTITKPGLIWANPFYTKRKVSLRVRNFETGKVKVNDLGGNPVEIAAVVVWLVTDSAEALFEVDNFEDYVRVQSEAAVRNLATKYPYDAQGEDCLSLSGNTSEVSAKLQEELQNRLEKAGVHVKEARISHLAYAQEIAAAMLQRQQATAVVAARTQIVEGAVGMVEMALEKLNQRDIVELDEERKAAMVSNLLVVLCSDRHTQPVINTGTLHN